MFFYFDKYTPYSHSYHPKGGHTDSPRQKGHQAWGQAHVYEVRATREVSPQDLSFVGHSDHDVLTLITCKGFDQTSGEYDLRLTVRAVLMNIE